MIYMIYGISDCPSCLHACADLMDADFEYVFVNCDFSSTFRNEIKKEFKWPTFPIIVRRLANNITVIGGYDQLKKHLI
jgi:glutaredoxin-related protein